jgi:N-acetylmuramoyl-L-alanine amidase
VVDIDGLALNDTLKSLVAKIESNDPYIKQVRVGQNRPNVVRLVFDLKEDRQAAGVQRWRRWPATKHRLIFDLYPVQAGRPDRRHDRKRRTGRDDGPPPPAPRRSRATPASARPARMRSPSWKPTPRAPAAPRPAPASRRRSRRRPGAA